MSHTPKNDRASKYISDSSLSQCLHACNIPKIVPEIDLAILEKTSEINLEKFEKIASPLYSTHPTCALTNGDYPEMALEREKKNKNAEILKKHVKKTGTTYKMCGNPRCGKFLVLEGGEGAGKSTQIQNIAQFLHQNDIPYLLTREPGGTPLAEQLRSVIVGEELDATEEILLILAARRHHIRMVIQPALDAGLWVLCDRFIDSSTVYQGLVGGLDEHLIHLWHQQSGCMLIPDRTFILQINPALALARRKNNPLTCNKFDQKDLDFHIQIYNAYNHIARRHPERYILIPAEGSLEEVAAAVLEEVKSLLSKS